MCTFTSILCTDQWHVHHTCPCYRLGLASMYMKRFTHEKNMCHFYLSIYRPLCFLTFFLLYFHGIEKFELTIIPTNLRNRVWQLESRQEGRVRKQLITHEWTEAGNALAYNHGTLLVGRCCFSIQESIQFLECSIPPEGLWVRCRLEFFLHRALPLVQSYVEHSRYTTWNAKMIPVSQQPSTRPSLVMSSLRRTGWCRSRRWLLVWLLHRHCKHHLNSTMQT